MSFRYWFKITILIIALSSTIVAIYLLKGGHSSQALTSLGLGGKQVLNWCHSRIATITDVKSGVTISEENGKWLLVDDTPRTLDYLGIEKWFAKYCQLPIEKLKFTDFNSPMQPLLKVKFIDDEELIFYDLGQERVQAGREVFLSPTLRKAIKELLAFTPKIQ